MKRITSITTQPPSGFVLWALSSDESSYILMEEGSKSLAGARRQREETNREEKEIESLLGLEPAYSGANKKQSIAIPTLSSRAICP